MMKTRMNTRTINPGNVASSCAHDQLLDTQDRVITLLCGGARRDARYAPRRGGGGRVGTNPFSATPPVPGRRRRPTPLSYPLPPPTPRDRPSTAARGGLHHSSPRATRPPRRPMCRRLLFYVGVVVVSSGAPVFRFGRDALSPRRVAVNFSGSLYLPFGLSRHSRPDVSPRNRLAVDVTPSPL